MIGESGTYNDIEKWVNSIGTESVKHLDPMMKSEIDIALSSTFSHDRTERMCRVYLGSLYKWTDAGSDCIGTSEELWDSHRAGERRYAAVYHALEGARFDMNILLVGKNSNFTQLLVEKLDKEKEFNTLRHKCLRGISANDGDKIINTLEPGVTLEERVFVKALVEIAN